MQDNITKLLGREVYSNNGVFIGEVEDIQVDTDEHRISGLALGSINDEVFGNEENKGVIIPYRWVNAVGDIVLIKDVVENIKAHKESEQEQI